MSLQDGSSLSTSNTTINLMNKHVQLRESYSTTGERDAGPKNAVCRSFSHCDTSVAILTLSSEDI